MGTGVPETALGPPLLGDKGKREEPERKKPSRNKEENQESAGLET